jgi:hypothetical protein
VVTHHDPDIAVVGCVGCGERVDEADLFREHAHFSGGCCTFLPFHKRCYRSAPPDPRPWTECAECGARFEPKDVLLAARWLAGYSFRLHPRESNEPVNEPPKMTRARERSAVPRPPAIRFVRVRQPGRHVPRVVVVTPLFAGEDRRSHKILGPHFEAVHALECARP